MKRIRIVSALLASAVLAALVIVTTTSKHAVRAVYAQSGCTNATLTGSYGFTYTGQILLGAKGPVNERFDAVGQATADGAGNFSANFTGSVNGVITTNNPYTATYTVNSDCTGSLTATPGSSGDNFNFVIVSGGAEVMAIDLTPGFTSTMVIKKQ